MELSEIALDLGKILVITAALVILRVAVKTVVQKRRGSEPEACSPGLNSDSHGEDLSQPGMGEE